MSCRCIKLKSNKTTNNTIPSSTVSSFCQILLDVYICCLPQSSVLLTSKLRNIKEKWSENWKYWKHTLKKESSNLYHLIHKKKHFSLKLKTTDSINNCHNNNHRKAFVVNKSNFTTCIILGDSAFKMWLLHGRNIEQTSRVMSPFMLMLHWRLSF